MTKTMEDTYVKALEMAYERGVQHSIETIQSYLRKIDSETFRTIATLIIKDLKKLKGETV